MQVSSVSVETKGFQSVKTRLSNTLYLLIVEYIESSGAADTTAKMARRIGTVALLVCFAENA